jgi:malate dehydrogenase (oxaloacetate-decarboxylating)
MRAIKLVSHRHLTKLDQILGIGDQGVGAILISIAKLAVYTICAGIHPTRTLPVVLDCGTNVRPSKVETGLACDITTDVLQNEKLLGDDLYLGLHRKRTSGKEYDQFVDRFVAAVKKSYPNAYIHFEDFGLGNARRILDKYTSKIACFNDDVQATGSVTLASIMTALKINKIPWEEARIVCFGAGTAGTGIADQIRDAISVGTSKSVEEAREQIW